MDKWERDICELRKTADKYHQESYATVERAVQLEWTFLKLVKKDTGQALTSLGKVLWETFLPRIFFGKQKILPPIVGALFFSVKKIGLGLKNPVTSEKEKYNSSLSASSDLIGSFKEERDF